MTMFAAPVAASHGALVGATLPWGDVAILGRALATQSDEAAAVTLGAALAGVTLRANSAGERWAERGPPHGVGQSKDASVQATWCAAAVVAMVTLILLDRQLELHRKPQACVTAISAVPVSQRGFPPRNRQSI